ncbi:UNVERIFIED_CONTAM: putative membrane protein [Sesamum angustifolium]|uniref:Membrane protein n=1 Tax=Sesamum angustifolium TaxID=2727405 RepID=A0AAW2L5F2_9LAMI
MAAPRILVVETGGGRLLDKDEEKNPESPTGKKYKAEKFPLSRWEVVAAFGVFFGVFNRVILHLPYHACSRVPDAQASSQSRGSSLAQTFMIPGTIFMSLLAGALFGVVRGLLLVVFNATAGASSCYFLSKLIGRPIVGCGLKSEIFSGRVKRRDKLLNYMLFLRVTPTLPNLFINLASPIVDIPFHIFFLATVIGLIPAAYITVRAGLALGDLKSVKDLYDFKTLALLFLIGILQFPTGSSRLHGRNCEFIVLQVKEQDTI